MTLHRLPRRLEGGAMAFACSEWPSSASHTRPQLRSFYEKDLMVA